MPALSVTYAATEEPVDLEPDSSHIEIDMRQVRGPAADV